VVTGTADVEVGVGVLVLVGVTVGVVVGVGVGGIDWKHRIQSPLVEKPYGPKSSLILSIPIVLLLIPTYETHEITPLTIA
jgi:hypothetical protein